MSSDGLSQLFDKYIGKSKTETEEEKSIPETPEKYKDTKTSTFFDYILDNNQQTVIDIKFLRDFKEQYYTDLASKGIKPDTLRTLIINYFVSLIEHRNKKLIIDRDIISVIDENAKTDDSKTNGDDPARFFSSSFDKKEYHDKDALIALLYYENTNVLKQFSGGAPTLDQFIQQITTERDNIMKLFDQLQPSSSVELVEPVQPTQGSLGQTSQIAQGDESEEENEKESVPGTLTPTLSRSPSQSQLPGAPLSRSPSPSQLQLPTQTTTTPSRSAPAAQAAQAAQLSRMGNSMGIGTGTSMGMTPGMSMGMTPGMSMGMTPGMSMGMETPTPQSLVPILTKLETMKTELNELSKKETNTEKDKRQKFQDIESLNDRIKTLKTDIAGKQSAAENILDTFTNQDLSPQAQLIRNEYTHIIKLKTDAEALEKSIKKERENIFTKLGRYFSEGLTKFINNLNVNASNLDKSDDKNKRQYGKVLKEFSIYLVKNEIKINTLQKDEDILKVIENFVDNLYPKYGPTELIDNVPFGVNKGSALEKTSDAFNEIALSNNPRAILFDDFNKDPESAVKFMQRVAKIGKLRETKDKSLEKVASAVATLGYMIPDIQSRDYLVLDMADGALHEGNSMMKIKKRLTKEEAAKLEKEKEEKLKNEQQRKSVAEAQRQLELFQVQKAAEEAKKALDAVNPQISKKEAAIRKLEDAIKQAETVLLATPAKTDEEKKTLLVGPRDMLKEVKESSDFSVWNQDNRFKDVYEKARKMIEEMKLGGKWWPFSRKLTPDKINENIKTSLKNIIDQYDSYKQIIENNIGDDIEYELKTDQTAKIKGSEIKENILNNITALNSHINQPINEKDSIIIPLDTIIELLNIVNTKTTPILPEKKSGIFRNFFRRNNELVTPLPETQTALTVPAITTSEQTAEQTAEKSIYDINANKIAIKKAFDINENTTNPIFVIDSSGLEISIPNFNNIFKDYLKFKDTKQIEIYLYNNLDFASYFKFKNIEDSLRFIFVKDPQTEQEELTPDNLMIIPFINGNGKIVVGSIYKYEDYNIDTDNPVNIINDIKTNNKRVKNVTKFRITCNGYRCPIEPISSSDIGSIEPISSSDIKITLLDQEEEQQNSRKPVSIYQQIIDDNNKYIIKEFPDFYNIINDPLNFQFNGSGLTLSINFNPNIKNDAFLNTEITELLKDNTKKPFKIGIYLHHLLYSFMNIKYYGFTDSNPHQPNIYKYDFIFVKDNIPIDTATFNIIPGINSNGNEVKGKIWSLNREYITGERENTFGEVIKLLNSNKGNTDIINVGSFEIKVSDESNIEQQQIREKADIKLNNARNNFGINSLLPQVDTLPNTTEGIRPVRNLPPVTRGTFTNQGVSPLPPKDKIPEPKTPQPEPVQHGLIPKVIRPKRLKSLKQTEQTEQTKGGGWFSKKSEVNEENKSDNGKDMSEVSSETNQSKEAEMKEKKEDEAEEQEREIDEDTKRIQEYKKSSEDLEQYKTKVVEIEDVIIRYKPLLDKYTIESPLVSLEQVNKDYQDVKLKTSQLEKEKEEVRAKFMSSSTKREDIDTKYELYRDWKEKLRELSEILSEINRLSNEEFKFSERINSINKIVTEINKNKTETDKISSIPTPIDANDKVMLRTTIIDAISKASKEIDTVIENQINRVLDNLEKRTIYGIDNSNKSALFGELKKLFDDNYARDRSSTNRTIPSDTYKEFVRNYPRYKQLKDQQTKIGFEVDVKKNEATSMESKLQTSIDPVELQNQNDLLVQAKSDVKEIMDHLKETINKIHIDKFKNMWLKNYKELHEGSTSIENLLQKLVDRTQRAMDDVKRRLESLHGIVQADELKSAEASAASSGESGSSSNGAEEQKNNKYLGIFGGQSEPREDINNPQVVYKILLEKMEQLKQMVEELISFSQRNSNITAMIATNGEPSMFVQLYKKYVEDRADPKISGVEASEGLIEGVNANKLAPREVLKIDIVDKSVFIGLTLMLRLFALSITNTLIDKRKIKTIETALAVYLAFYTALFIAFVILVNVDMYRMRIIFNYINVHGGYGAVILHIVLLWLFSSLLFIILRNVRLITNPHNNKGNEARTNEQRAMLRDRVSLISGITWFVTSLFASLS